MKHLALAGLVLVGLVGAAAASPVVGQSVIYRYDSTHSYAATVAFLESDGSADLTVYSWATTAFGFGPSSFFSLPATWAVGVVEGSGDNRWSVNPNIGLGATGATGPAGAAGSTGSTGATGSGALVTSSSTPTLALNGSAVQFDSTHDTEYVASVKISTTLSLSGGSAGHVDLVCDASTTPTTIVETVSSESTGTLTIGLNLASSNTLVLRYRVPAAHRCKLTTTNDTGTPTITIVRQVLQTLG